VDEWKPLPRTRQVVERCAPLLAQYLACCLTSSTAATATAAAATAAA